MSGEDKKEDDRRADYFLNSIMAILRILSGVLFFLVSLFFSREWLYLYRLFVYSLIGYSKIIILYNKENNCGGEVSR